MSIVSAKEIMVEAAKGGYAIGAFNITNLIQIEGVVDAAVEKRSPVILQTSVMTSKFLGADMFVAIYRTVASAAPVPICLHLNHGTEAEYCKKCADTGYTSVMIDASVHPFDENIRQTREVVQYCHKAGGISVEGGLGSIGDAGQAAAGDGDVHLVNPAQAAEFVETTGLDMFAPAVGTAHGIYETPNPRIDFQRLAEINHALNGERVRTPLVVHGGTGLSEDYVRRLIQAGGAKFNVSTELKRTMIDAQFNYISANREEYEPGRIDVVGRDAVRKAVSRWIDVLGSAGKA
jgi:tagatose 1,6-diphosphate aldolase GatY/KbaY